ncbi:MAG: hypothetical protein ABSA45_01395 [Verrucomicrobiota bacterium]
MSPFEIWHGRDKPPGKSSQFEAGPVTAQFADGDLRRLRVGGIEIIRRIYVAVRDQNWRTIPGKISNLEIQAGHNQFQVGFDVRHKQMAVDFAWHGQIAGTPEGAITYSMKGKVISSFRYNRIGFCILHPPTTTAGQPYRGLASTGPIRGTLPKFIGPQRFENSTYIPLFPAVRQLALDLAGGATIRLDFEGDWFEMEDQRNWTDHSFKTYCTPLALPFPRTAQRGKKIEQKVTLTLEKKPGRMRDPRPELCLSIGTGGKGRLPELGLGMASHGLPLATREVHCLRRLHLDHLRVDLRLSSGARAADQLRQAAAASQQLGCRLEAALFLNGDAVAQLERLAGWIQPSWSFARFLVFHENEDGAADRWIRAARARLQPLAPSTEFAVGSNAYFAELNRNRPETAEVDAIVYPITPQVHAFDETSMIENLEAQAVTVQSARSWAGRRRLVASPVTLKPRFNANATEPEAANAARELPASVDPRQMSLFAAAWTLGSVKYLAESGASSVTYYETTGWRGVMETEAGSRLPARFPSAPGLIFPLYHLFFDLAQWKSAEIVTCRSTDPLRAVGLAFRRPRGCHLLAANLTAEHQIIRLALPGVGGASCRTLDASNAPDAMKNPEFFAAAAKTRPLRRDKPTLELAPYAISLVDLTTK